MNYKHLKTLRDLDAWKSALGLTTEIYRISKR